MFYPLLSGAISRAQAGAAQSTAQEAQRKATSAEENIDLLKSDIERLLMITEALWMFLKTAHGYKDEDLTKLITQIDLRDGKLDGRVAASPPRACPYCGQTLYKKRPFCMYCGKPVSLDPFRR